MKITFLFN